MALSIAVGIVVLAFSGARRPTLAVMIWLGIWFSFIGLLAIFQMRQWEAVVPVLASILVCGAYRLVGQLKRQE